MKKLIMTIALSGMVGFMITSCNKTADWQCTCTIGKEVVYQSTSNDTKRKPKRSPATKWKSNSMVQAAN